MNDDCVALIGTLSVGGVKVNEVGWVKSVKNKTFNFLKYCINKILLNFTSVCGVGRGGTKIQENSL